MIGQYGETHNWKSMYADQIDRLKSSGLYNEIQFIDLFVKGMTPIPIDELPEKVNNVTYLGDLEEERPTNSKLYRAYNQIMQRIWTFSNANPEYKILFFHSLGVSRHNTDVGEKTKRFREYFEKCLIDYWKYCIELLNYNDCVGVEYSPTATFVDETLTINAPHYQGFFWWANASYLKKLDPCYFYQDVIWQAYLCELWIGSGNPKAYSIYNTWKNRYWDYLDDVPYDKILMGINDYLLMEKKNVSG